MTVTLYLFTFDDPDGGKFHGSIACDKYTPRRLKATLAPHETKSMVGYPIWSVTAPNNPKGLVDLVGKTKRKARAMGLVLVAEKKTTYPVG